MRLRQLFLLLYPFGAGAMAVNCFLLSLLGHSFGLPVLATREAIFAGCVVAVPLTWLFAKHIHRLMREADEN